MFSSLSFLTPSQFVCCRHQLLLQKTFGNLEESPTQLCQSLLEVLRTALPPQGWTRIRVSPLAQCTHTCSPLQPSQWESATDRNHSCGPITNTTNAFWCCFISSLNLPLENSGHQHRMHTGITRAALKTMNAWVPLQHFKDLIALGEAWTPEVLK